MESITTPSTPPEISSYVPRQKGLVFLFMSRVKTSAEDRPKLRQDLVEMLSVPKGREDIQRIIHHLENGERLEVTYSSTEGGLFDPSAFSSHRQVRLEDDPTKMCYFHKEPSGLRTAHRFSRGNLIVHEFNHCVGYMDNKDDFIARYRTAPIDMRFRNGEEFKAIVEGENAYLSAKGLPMRHGHDGLLVPPDTNLHQASLNYHLSNGTLSEVLPMLRDPRFTPYIDQNKVANFVISRILDGTDVEFKQIISAPEFASVLEFPLVKLSVQERPDYIALRKAIREEDIAFLHSWENINLLTRPRIKKALLETKSFRVLDLFAQKNLLGGFTQRDIEHFVGYELNSITQRGIRQEHFVNFKPSLELIHWLQSRHVPIYYNFVNCVSASKGQNRMMLLIESGGLTLDQLKRSIERGLDLYHSDQAGNYLYDYVRNTPELKTYLDAHYPDFAHLDNLTVAFAGKNPDEIKAAAEACPRWLAHPIFTKELLRPRFRELLIHFVQAGQLPKEALKKAVVERGSLVLAQKLLHLGLLPNASEWSADELKTLQLHEKRGESTLKSGIESGKISLDLIELLQGSGLSIHENTVNLTTHESKQNQAMLLAQKGELTPARLQEMLDQGLNLEHVDELGRRLRDYLNPDSELREMVTEASIREALPLTTRITHAIAWFIRPVLFAR
ncbi:MAG: hypothetical protein MRY21_03105 [Simkaniaceae bacterium]|nr:hypothetical protein [Simkaniaceae bacterium]